MCVHKCLWFLLYRSRCISIYFCRPYGGASWVMQLPHIDAVSRGSRGRVVLVSPLYVQKHYRWLSKRVMENVDYISGKKYPILKIRVCSYDKSILCSHFKPVFVSDSCLCILMKRRVYCTYYQPRRRANLVSASIQTSSHQFRTRDHTSSSTHCHNVYDNQPDVARTSV